jgi:molecular chaperone GrpE
MPADGIERKVREVIEMSVENGDSAIESAAAEDQGSVNPGEGAVVPELDTMESSPSSSVNEEEERLRREVHESRDRYLRLMADFENFKKRSLKDQADLRKYQGEQIFLDMLDVMDNLELALGHADADPGKLREGLQLIHKMFVERLGKWEVKGESSMGALFDPTKHSAISQIESADQKPGTIVGELKKAYYYKDKLLRHGEVVVATEVTG